MLKEENAPPLEAAARDQSPGMLNAPGAKVT
jgi:hypothetical protein